MDVRGGTGVCLTADRGFAATYGAVIFDSTLAPRHRLTITGIPSRTRVAPDGTLAAITTFVSGHSYAGGSFSTRTVIIDTATGRRSDRARAVRRVPRWTDHQSSRLQLLGSDVRARLQHVLRNARNWRPTVADRGRCPSTDRARRPRWRRMSLDLSRCDAYSVQEADLRRWQANLAPCGSGRITSLSRLCGRREVSTIRSSGWTTTPFSTLRPTTNEVSAAQRVGNSRCRRDADEDAARRVFTDRRSHEIESDAFTCQLMQT